MGVPCVVHADDHAWPPHAGCGLAATQQTLPGLCLVARRSVDIWSFGITFVELVTGRSPYYDTSPEGLAVLADPDTGFVPQGLPEVRLTDLSCQVSSANTSVSRHLLCNTLSPAHLVTIIRGYAKSPAAITIFSHHSRCNTLSDCAAYPMAFGDNRSRWHCSAGGHGLAAALPQCGPRGQAHCRPVAAGTLFCLHR